MRISDWSSDVCSSDLPKSRSVRPLDSFARGISRNHFHVWWGENYTVEQVSNNAEPTYGVKQGDWHLTDEFPVYTTQSEASVSVRSGAHTQLGRASCGERVCKYGSISGVAVSLKQKKIHK